MNQNESKILEKQLIKGLQPIREFVLAQALYHFLDMGIQKAIADSPNILIIDLAKQLNLHVERLKGFLQYLCNEGYVLQKDNDSVSLSDSGVEIAMIWPWYKLLVGGYSQTFQQIGITLKANGNYATRDSACVGVGSCGISQYDAIPMTRKLLAKIPDNLGTVVDLGCGDGSYLIDLCKSMPDIRGVGVDPDENSVQSALQSALYFNISDRIVVKVGNATSPPDLSQEPPILVFITAFVLQEILQQSGRNSIINLFKNVFSKHPDSYWIVIEVDHRPNDSTIMNTGLGLGYYNPYYLIHQLTEQKLEKTVFWENLFADAGLKIISTERPDPSYDSLGLKVGYLLSKK